MDYFENLENNVKNGSVVKIQLEKEIYSKSTVLKSCYKFTDRTYIYINTYNEEDVEYFNIYLESKTKVDGKQLLAEFMNELLDQELRNIIANETHKVRDTIVTRALLSGQPNDN